MNLKINKRASIGGSAVSVLLVGAAILNAVPALAAPFADPAFQRVWNRTDSLVASGQVSRTWFWGPGANTPGLLEQYNQGQNRQRLVQYFDKSRMEINNPQGDRSQPFF